MAIFNSYVNYQRVTLVIMHYNIHIINLLHLTIFIGYHILLTYEKY